MSEASARVVSRHDQVAALLNPRHVTIVGAQNRPGSWSGRIHQNLQRFGFGGPITAVNPKHATLWDEPCYPDLAQLPEDPDHLLILVPAARAVDVVEEGIGLGARSATILSSFPHGPLMDRLRDLSAETGFAVSGPNCFGNVSATSSLVTMPDNRLGEIRDGQVSIVGQSGGVVAAMYRILMGRGIGIRYAVSSGNEACLRMPDYIRFFASDDEVRVALVFVEGVSDWDEFADACAELRARGKWIVAVKVGHAAASRAAAASHTGALAGSFAAFEAVAARSGVISVGSLDVAIEACEYLSRVPAPAGAGIGVVAISGGVRELMLDAGARQAIEFPTLTSSVVATLASVVPGVEATNPLDAGYAAFSDVQTLIRCVETVATDENIDVVLLQEELLGVEEPRKLAALEAMNHAFAGGVVADIGVPVALFSMGSVNVTPFGRDLRDRLPDLAFTQSIDRALAAVAAMVRARRWDPSVAAQPADDARARRSRVTPILAAAGPAMNEIDAKEILRGYGFTTPREAFAATPGGARAAAAELDPPFVVKLVAAGAQHKSELGGVHFDLADADAVEHVGKELQGRHADLDGFLVAEQVSRSRVELIVGFVRDPEVGPVVVVGAGGTEAELHDDVVLLPVPCTADDARAALAGTPIAKLLGEWRGRPACDVDAVVEAVRNMSVLADELGDLIVSAEINPLAAVPGRQGVLVLDALVIPSGQARP